MLYRTYTSNTRAAVPATSTCSYAPGLLRYNDTGTKFSPSTALEFGNLYWVVGASVRVPVLQSVLL